MVHQPVGLTCVGGRTGTAAGCTACCYVRVLVVSGLSWGSCTHVDLEHARPVAVLVAC
jgi:hypothetical protein